MPQNGSRMQPQEAKDPAQGLRQGADKAKMDIHSHKCSQSSQETTVREWKWGMMQDEGHRWVAMKFRLKGETANSRVFVTHFIFLILRPPGRSAQGLNSLRFGCAQPPASSQTYQVEFAHALKFLNHRRISYLNPRSALVIFTLGQLNVWPCTDGHCRDAILGSMPTSICAVEHNVDGLLKCWGLCH
jgi:hypothetical protein